MVVEKSSVLSQAELISALYDGNLTEAEAREAIELIMSDEKSAQLWQDLCLVSDVMKAQNVGENLHIGLHTQVMARLSAECTTQEIIHTQASPVFIVKIKHFLECLQSSCWRRTTVGVLCSSVLFLSVLSVWSPSGVFFWRSDKMNSYSALPMDSSANSVSIKQELADSVENELAKHYLQKHQEAVLSGL